MRRKKKEAPPILTDCGAGRREKLGEAIADGGYIALMPLRCNPNHSAGLSRHLGCGAFVRRGLRGRAGDSLSMRSRCKIDGCDKRVVGFGLCMRHYRRFKRYGDPLAGRVDDGEPERFLAIAAAYRGDECLIWPYGKVGDGYAAIRDGEKKIQVHRRVCEIVHGKPPSPSHLAAHSCGNGHLGCISPNHLRWATHKENMQDRFMHARLGFGRHGANGPKVAEVT
jgi:hypothetical protein